MVDRNRRRQQTLPRVNTNLAAAAVAGRVADLLTGADG
jgi:hypothetical protein